jgi:hypothetical protein
MPILEFLSTSKKKKRSKMFMENAGLGDFEQKVPCKNRQESKLT